MTTEIESIGLAMDTSGVERGIRSLDELAARGPKVERSRKCVETAATEAGKGVSSLGASNAKGLDGMAKAGAAAGRWHPVGGQRLQPGVEQLAVAGEQRAAAAPARQAAASRADVHNRKADVTLAAPAAVPGDACASAQARVDDWLKGRAMP